ncbi:hypothetical protein AAZX31_02G181300 [Glycine max]|uniref:DUF7271 domain-containing protein n=1 Tax=Glycine max TaxID=3847 RepID=K7K9J3_SOYBN|nr:hypothetical protein GYH30_004563 [Glycine max]KRH72148.1 hypothetical protein GLYMA_02G194200v4 [Glycine max]
MKNPIIGLPLIIQFIAAFNNDKNIIQLPTFYHTQWAPQYHESVHLRYDGVIYEIQCVFDIHFIPPLERQTCDRQRHSSRKHISTVRFTQEMLNAPEPLKFLLKLVVTT